MAKIGRNEPCHCGSGLKFKKCHGTLTNTRNNEHNHQDAQPNFKNSDSNHSSDEIVRKLQQGLGRPIISGRVGDNTFVATGKTLHTSTKWRAFPDFLFDYIMKVLGSDWGNAELAKPQDLQHPIIQWYRIFSNQQKPTLGPADAPLLFRLTGAACCYLGLAYNLYLLSHNVELQTRLVSRLKDPKQFQGAYYELIVANCLIRAGYKLELEDESDRSSKHCEFSAYSETTGTRYWVEAKARSVPGVLGKTLLDGSTSNDPTSQLTKHIGEALKKPAPNKRMIFVDLNAPIQSAPDAPHWLDQAARRLDAREHDLLQGQEAYVFVTNLPFHRSLDDSVTIREILAHGLGMPDFGKPGPVRLSDWYREKKKHTDAYAVLGTQQNYPQIPDTFDGRPASESLSGEPDRRIKIGETYFFNDIGKEGIIGKVSSVAVLENEKKAYISISSTDGQGMILTQSLTEHELDDYKKYGDAFFGESKQRNHNTKDIFELYEFFVESYIATPRARLLELAKDHPNIEHLKNLNDLDLVLEVCESWAGSVGQTNSATN